MPEEASTHSCRHVITRAIGTYESVKVDTVIYDLKNCEYLLICSDGLTTMLSDAEILEETQKTSTQEEKATALITCANQKGGLDNIAVILRKTSEVRKSC
jgi:protein phosphatase